MRLTQNKLVAKAAKDTRKPEIRLVDLAFHYFEAVVWFGDSHFFTFGIDQPLGMRTVPATMPTFGR